MKRTARTLELARLPRGAHSAVLLELATERGYPPALSVALVGEDGELRGRIMLKVGELAELERAIAEVRRAQP